MQRGCVFFLFSATPAAAYVATKYFDTRNDTTNYLRVLGRRGNTKFRRLFLGGGGKQNRLWVRNATRSFYDDDRRNGFGGGFGEKKREKREKDL